LVYLLFSFQCERDYTKSSFKIPSNRFRQQSSTQDKFLQPPLSQMVTLDLQRFGGIFVVFLDHFRGFPLILVRTFIAPPLTVAKGRSPVAHFPPPRLCPSLDQMNFDPIGSFFACFHRRYRNPIIGLPVSCSPSGPEEK